MLLGRYLWFVLFTLGPFCGNAAPTNFTIPSSHAIVEFNSDNSDGYAGFKVQWTVVGKFDYFISGKLMVLGTDYLP